MNSPASNEHRTRDFQTVCAVALTCLLAYGIFLARIHEGYHPADDPLQAHIAERVMHGELPNFNVHDVYTGGLALLHALSLKLFGTRLISLRYMLFSVFVLWVPTFWWIASRFISKWTASLVTILAVLWGTPVYPTPLGSWYSLFFATFSTAALFAFLQSEKRIWIFISGVLTGLSFLVKISGLYLLTANGLFLIYLEHRYSRNTDRKTAPDFIFSASISLPLVALALILTRLIRVNPTVGEWVQFVLPSLALIVALAYMEWTSGHSPLRQRLRKMVWLVSPLILGAILPVAAFLIPYIARGALKSWLIGVFVLPAVRLQFALFPPVHPVGIVLCLPLLLLLLVDAAEYSTRTRWTILGAISLVYSVVLFLCSHHVLLARLVWVSAATLIPPLVVLAAVKLVRAGTSPQLMLVAAVAALGSLVQFPFSHPLYFFYVAPLAILLISALRVRPKGVSLLVAPVLFYAGFIVLAVYSGNVNGVSLFTSPNQAYANSVGLDLHSEAAFSLPRAGGLTAPSQIVRDTEKAVAEALNHANGGPIYAGPDSPQFYFFTGLRNPTPNVIEILSGGNETTQSILSAITNAQVGVVVINHAPHHSSGPMSPELLSRLRELYPEFRQFGFFEVRWKR